MIEFMKAHKHFIIFTLLCLGLIWEGVVYFEYFSSNIVIGAMVSTFMIAVWFGVYGVGHFVINKED